MKMFPFVLVVVLAMGLVHAESPFLGFPEDKERLIEWQPNRNMRAMPAKVMNKLCEAEYSEYIQAVCSGRIGREERRGDYLYYATSVFVLESNETPPSLLPPDQKASLPRLTERFKARIPSIDPAAMDSVVRRIADIIPSDWTLVREDFRLLVIRDAPIFYQHPSSPAIFRDEHFLALEKIYKKQHHEKPKGMVWDGGTTGTLAISILFDREMSEGQREEIQQSNMALGEGIRALLENLKKMDPEGLSSKPEVRRARKELSDLRASVRVLPRHYSGKYEIYPCMFGRQMGSCLVSPRGAFRERERILDAIVSRLERYDAKPNQDKRIR